MSNNFLIRQFLKAGGSFFIGASIAMGIICPIVLNSQRASANSSDYDIPTNVNTNLSNLDNQGITPSAVVFAPNGGWVILYNPKNQNTQYPANNALVSSDFPQDVTNQIKSVLTQNGTISTIAFTPKGEWVILYNKNSAIWSTNFPPNAASEIQAQQKQNVTINTIAFAPNGGWVIIVNNNGYFYTSSLIPSVLGNDLATLHNENQTINTIAFTPNGGWVIFYSDPNSPYIANNTAYSNIPTNAANAITNEHNQNNNLINIAFTSNNGWVLLYEDDLAKLGGTAGAFGTLVP